MLFSTVGQGALFLWMTAGGMVIGAWYALTALLRRVIGAGFYLSLACDLLFGAGCAAIFILFSVAGSYGRLRLFDVLAALLGMLLFHLAFRRPLDCLGRLIRRGTGRAVAAMAASPLLRRVFK